MYLVPDLVISVSDEFDKSSLYFGQLLAVLTMEIGKKQ
jgi:hypothetical protein